MRSKKERAIQLRKSGASIRDIEAQLSIARSTLSYWLRNIALSDAHARRLKERWNLALIGARLKASQWHHEQKAKRMDLALQQATTAIDALAGEAPPITELALAMLYLGEGFKKSGGTGMGNSDPMILRFFLSAMERVYGLNRSSFGFELHLRADQNPSMLIRHWSKQLGISRSQFTKPLIDKRTKGRPTYPDYHGVCSVQCGNVAVQRKLMYIANLFCDKVIMGA